MDTLDLVLGLAAGYLLAYLVHGVIRRLSAGAVARTEYEALVTERDGLRNELALNEGRREQERAQAGEAKEQLAKRAGELAEASRELATARERIRHLEENLEQGKKELAQLLEKNRAEFENLARKLLEENTAKFTETNKERLGELLRPFQQRITDFRETVESTHKAQDERFVTFQNELKHLRELNRQVSDEANALTRALKGETRRQGVWGEMLLEKILEKSGLTEGEEYVTQGSFTVEVDGEKTRVRPDVIVNLPDERHVVIDSKVSLTAYAAYVNAEDEAAAEKALGEHVLSVNSHIKGITVKNYQQAHGLNSLDFILVFIPIESAFNLALRRDTTLYDTAFEKNIVIVTPSTLLATLRVVENLWRQEKQNANALKIAQEAGRLHDKFVAFLEDMEELDQRLAQARRAFDAAENKLSTGKGNLVRRTDSLRELGARATKQLPDGYRDEG
jgi:DNA recombination protein RmuC